MIKNISLSSLLVAIVIVVGVWKIFWAILIRIIFSSEYGEESIIFYHTNNIVDDLKEVGNFCPPKKMRLARFFKRPVPVDYFWKSDWPDANLVYVFFHKSCNQYAFDIKHGKGYRFYCNSCGVKDPFYF